MRKCTNTIRRSSRSSLRGPQRGFVLMVGLILLVVVTLLSMSMFRGFGMQERIAGNTRDKQRSYEAAQSALQFGEWWLLQEKLSSAVACSGVVNVSTQDDVQVCATALTTPETLTSWDAARFDYVPPGMSISTLTGGGGVNATSNDINYQAKPSFHIYYMGVSDGGKTMLFQVSAKSAGGNLDTVSVIQSTFEVEVAGVSDKSGPYNRPPDGN